MIKTLRMTTLALLTFFMQLSAHASAPTKQDAQAIVDKAASYAAQNGAEKLVVEANKKEGQFHQGDLYVFVFDLNGTLVANPAFPNLVGQNNVAQPDADGKLFRKDILSIAKTQGSGWVDYKWMNPVSGKIEQKTSYVKKQGDLIIGAGIFVN